MNIERFALIEKRLAVRRTVVLMVTLWMTWRSFAWAAEYALQVLQTKGDGVGAAAMIAAVTAPISYLLKAVLTNYVDAKVPAP